MVGKPRLIPIRCGILRFTPKFTPEVISIILLGPGVIPDEKANNAIASINSIDRSTPLF
jgi:hypothetical protein